jgi:hypothetical protein
MAFILASITVSAPEHVGALQRKEKSIVSPRNGATVVKSIL